MGEFAVSFRLFVSHALVYARVRVAVLPDTVEILYACMGGGRNRLVVRG